MGVGGGWEDGGVGGWGGRVRGDSRITSNLLYSTLERCTGPAH